MPSRPRRTVQHSMPSRPRRTVKPGWSATRKAFAGFGLLTTAAVLAKGLQKTRHRRNLKAFDSNLKAFTEMPRARNAVNDVSRQKAYDNKRNKLMNIGAKYKTLFVSDAASKKEFQRVVVHQLKLQDRVKIYKVADFV